MAKQNTKGAAKGAKGSKSNKGTKKRKVVVESVGEAHISASFNNILVSLTNKKGDVISWSSAGKMGFRGSKKNTPYAAQLASEDASKVAHDAGLRKVKVYVKGPGNGRESAIRSIHNSGIEVSEIIDVTPLPHNGCRAPKRRRV
ncbi:30S ribosomal protein S11 [Flavimarina sp. Hel_I_48]|uniref:30S ribosomal protein S11 n=1 Tax=Flavimarina sp. Hel_I_48 TaxID=1392488 RepID=UPI0004DF9F3F|nr:30S ribosomal protein S11 [Flavimarina sp. Hel_I_48]